MGSLSHPINNTHPDHHHHQNSVSRLGGGGGGGGFNSDKLSGTVVSGECFDLSSDVSTQTPFGILEAFNRNNNNHSQGLHFRPAQAQEETETAKKGKGREWVLKKKEQLIRRKGNVVPQDTKYTARKRKAALLISPSNLKAWMSNRSSVQALQFIHRV
ncbi:hypothetical protein ACOSQ3_013831 [Xanthoceras sorbifolium]